MLALILGACGCPSSQPAPELIGRAPEEPKKDPVVAAKPPGSTCTSERWWTQGDEPSPDMMPGSECLGCHGPDDTLPFAAAGTVYPTYGEPDDCYGLEGFTVQIIDHKKRTYERKTSKSGNFTLTLEDAPDLAYPITANVIGPDGNAAPKVTPLYSGDCNECHSKTGVPKGARGRVIANPRSLL